MLYIFGGKEGKPNTLNMLDNIATSLVKSYALEKHDGKVIDFGVFIVWKGFVLGNVKYLISTTIHDGMYYEVTYHDAKKEWYLDAYEKEKNICYPDKEALLILDKFN